MSLRDHLVELRRRLTWAAAGLAVGAVAGWFVSGWAMNQLLAPIVAASAEQPAIIAANFAGVAAAFDMRLKVALFLGALISSPWWIYQLWAFVTPGLTRRERLYAVGFVAAAVPLFLLGAAAAWLVIPHAVLLFTGFLPAGATNLIDAQTWLAFVMRFVLAFGLAFLLPVLMVALDFAGVVRATTWRKGWRWAVMIAFLFAAVMTPTPDAISMLLVALPICALYFVALGVCEIHDRRAARRAPVAEAAA